jgi:hypothetical protein
VADNYSVLFQRQTIQVLGDQDVRDVVEVTIQTKPSGVVYTLNTPVATATPDHIASLAAGTSEVIETDLRHPNVQTITLGQNLDASGILRPIADVYVQSNSGNGQGVVQIIQPDLNEPQFSQRIQPEIDRLNAIEAL